MTFTRNFSNKVILTGHALSLLSYFPSLPPSLPLIPSLSFPLPSPSLPSSPSPSLPSSPSPSLPPSLPLCYSIVT